MVVFWLLFQLLSAWVYGRVVGGVFNHCHLCKCTVQPLLPSPKLQFKSPIYSIYTFISNELNLIIYICTTLGSPWSGLHHVKELLVIDQTVLVLVCLVQNVIDLLLGDRLPHELHHQPQLPPVDVAIAVLVTLIGKLCMKIH